MPAIKSDLHIEIRYRSWSFTLNGKEISSGKFLLKKGRSWSKIPIASTTEIFAICLKWIASKSKEHYFGVEA